MGWFKEQQFTSCQAGAPHVQTRAPLRTHQPAISPRSLHFTQLLGEVAGAGLGSARQQVGSSKSSSRLPSRRLFGSLRSSDLLSIDASAPAGSRLSLQARQDSKPRRLTMARAAALAMALVLGLSAVAAQNSPGAGLGRAGGPSGWGRPTTCW